MWADLLLIIVIAGLTFAGFKRGMVHELTDWVVIIGAGTLGMRGCRIIGTALHNGPFAGWSESATFKLAFWMIFIPVALGLLSLGLHLDRVTREQERFPEAVRNYVGVVLAFFKSMVLASLIVVWIPNSNTMTPVETRSFHRAPMVNFVRLANPMVTALVYVTCPSDLAAKFGKMMQSR